MKEITSRQREILKRIVEEYVLSAEPVSSSLLEERYDFGVSSATIRSEMKKMLDAGYLTQPHTSAGRVPTDQAYRFFIEKEMKKMEELELAELRRKMNRLKKLDVWDMLSGMSQFLASESSYFSVSGLIEKSLFFEEGWEDVLKEPEFEEKECLVSFARMVKKFEKEKKEIESMPEGITLYIGSENPWSRLHEFSVIVGKCRLKGAKGVFSLMGPKRMPYWKNIRLVKNVKSLLEE